MNRHVVFRAGPQRFALPLESAREVVPPPRTYTRIPRAPEVARGVMNVRGRIVTVIDLARLLELGSVDSGLARVIVLEARRRDVGLLVDEVLAIEELELEPAEATGPPMCVGLARSGGEPVTLIGPELLMAAVSGAFALPG